MNNTGVLQYLESKLRQLSHTDLKLGGGYKDSTERQIIGVRFSLEEGRALVLLPAIIERS